jgi:GGDEF domain-containing protein
VIVLSLLRQAIGTLQAPPNQVLIGLALFLTFFVMAPAFEKAYQDAYVPFSENKIDLMTAAERGVVPFREFMLKQTRQSDLALFVRLSNTPPLQGPEEVPLKVLAKTKVATHVFAGRAPDGRVRIVSPAVANALTVGTVVEALCLRAGLQVSDVNVAALTDPLTGLPNRRAALERLRHLHGLGRRGEHAGFTLVLLDLDHFKQVNDRLDHVLTGPLGSFVRAHDRRLDDLEHRVDAIERRAG